MKKVIAFCGARSSGKSEAAKLLAERLPWVRKSFATPLYQMLAVVMGGQDLRALNKNEPRQELQGKSIGQALQFLGTEWGREMIGEEIWVDTMEREIAYELTYHRRVVIDDLRFNNEYEMLRGAGATIVRVERPGAFPDVDLRDPNHPSERDWPSFEVDAVLHNESCSLNTLNKDLVRLLTTL